MSIAQCWYCTSVVDPDPGTPLNPELVQIRIRIRIHNSGWYSVHYAFLVKELESYCSRVQGTLTPRPQQVLDKEPSCLDIWSMPRRSLLSSWRSPMSRRSSSSPTLCGTRWIQQTQRRSKYISTCSQKNLILDSKQKKLKLKLKNSWKLTTQIISPFWPKNF